MQKEIGKSRILQYLQFAPNEIDLLHFVQWLEAYGNGLFHVNTTEKVDERTRS